MKELGIRTIEEFGERIGISRGTMYTVYSGRLSANGTPIKPSVDTLIALAKGLEVPLYWLIYLLGPETLGDANYQSIADDVWAMGASEKGQKLLSGIDSSILLDPELLDLYPAGWDSQLIKNMFNDVVGYTWVEQNPRRDGEIRGFLAFGDSMNGGSSPIRSGDVILVDDRGKVEDGELAVIEIGGDERLCRLQKEDQYIAVNLSKTDPTPFAIHSNEVQLIGRVVEIRRKLRSH